MQSYKHIVSPLISFEQDVIDHRLPPFLVHLALEVDQEIMVVFLVPKTVTEFLPIFEIISDAEVHWHRRSLISFVIVIVPLDLIRRCPKSVQGQEMVSDVIMETLRVKEAVMFVMVLLEAIRCFACRFRSDVWQVEDTARFSRKYDSGRRRHIGI